MKQTTSGRQVTANPNENTFNRVSKTQEEVDLRAQADMEAKAKEFMEKDVPVRQDQKTDIPHVDNPEAAAEARASRDDLDDDDEEARKDLKERWERGQEVVRKRENAQRQAVREARKKDAAAVKVSDAEDPYADIDWFKVKLLRGYVPKTSFRIMEGSALRIYTVPEHQTHDKLQPFTTLELPIEDARYCIERGIAERADPLP